MELSPVIQTRTVLSKIRWSSQTVARGYQPLIQMAPSIVTMRRGCVYQWSWERTGRANTPWKRLFTDTDMHNTIMREEIEDFYDYLQRLLRIDNRSIPSKNYDLVLDIMVTDDEQISWSYYYACHDARCLFWLETYDASYMISELFGVKSPAHVSTSHLSHPESLAISTNVMCRAPFGVPLLVGLLPTGLML